MKKADMKRALFKLAAESIASYPYCPGDILGDRVAEARWEQAKAEVAERLNRYGSPPQRKKEP